MITDVLASEMGFISCQDNLEINKSAIDRGSDVEIAPPPKKKCFIQIFMDGSTCPSNS